MLIAAPPAGYVMVGLPPRFTIAVYEATVAALKTAYLPFEPFAIARIVPPVISTEPLALLIR